MGRNNADQRGWGPGWPNCQPGQMVWLKRADGFNQPLRAELVPLVAWLMDETERRGYDIRPDWSWGYNCLSGDTLVMTADGDVPLADLAGTTARLLTRQPIGKGARASWVDAPIRSYGEQPLMRIELSRNGRKRQVFATAEHRWFVSRRNEQRVDGLRVAGYFETEATTKALAAGDRLASCWPTSIASRGDRKQRPRWVVESVTLTDRIEEVFCAEVEGTECFALSDYLLTGNCRAIRGTMVASNHSWGLALDINAPTNPMQFGSPGWSWLRAHGRTDMPSWLPDLWIAHGFYWGGNYDSRQDAMHMEFVLTPADAARIIAGLHGDPVRGKPSTLTFTGVAEHVGDSGPVVSAIQQMLHDFAASHNVPQADPGPVDGRYGPRTGAAVVAFKMWVRTLNVAYHQPVVFPTIDNVVGLGTYTALQYWVAH